MCSAAIQEESLIDPRGTPKQHSGSFNERHREGSSTAEMLAPPGCPVRSHNLEPTTAMSQGRVRRLTDNMLLQMPPSRIQYCRIIECPGSVGLFRGRFQQEACSSVGWDAVGTTIACPLELHQTFHQQWKCTTNGESGYMRHHCSCHRVSNPSVGWSHGGRPKPISSAGKTYRRPSRPAEEDCNVCGNTIHRSSLTIQCKSKSTDESNAAVNLADMKVQR